MAIVHIGTTTQTIKITINIELNGKQEIEQFGADFNQIFYHVKEQNKDGNYGNETLRVFKEIDNKINFTT